MLVITEMRSQIRQILTKSGPGLIWDHNTGFSLLTIPMFQTPCYYTPQSWYNLDLTRNDLSPPHGDFLLSPIHPPTSGLCLLPSSGAQLLPPDPGLPASPPSSLWDTTNQPSGSPRVQFVDTSSQQGPFISEDFEFNGIQDFSKLFEY